ncbi:MAG TPA: lysophospholipid acyltransferase family protein [Vicinamibacterales bacterium]|nr:lysophospholipid acyltransferase family protein [Vicinamibacterales bacterium]
MNDVLEVRAVAAGGTRAFTAVWRARVLGVSAILIITATALALVPIGIVTAFRARRLYSRIAALAAVGVLRLYGIRVRVLPRWSFPREQVIYISNHSSTLDLFVLVALGLPNCRFFLSGFLRKFVPLGAIAWMMGTFFTVPQDRPEERRQIFQRAERVLRRTRESVYLSPEGGRITSGEIGHFNKGAFHLATNLHVPIVPLYFEIPPDMDPGRGYDARPGDVIVHIMPSIDTGEWTLEDLPSNVASVRDLYVRRHRVRHA